MKNSNSFISLVLILLTYVIVKIGHKLAGFHYDIFSEGIMNVKFLIDIMSWGIVYAILYFLLKKLLPLKNI
jgi:hypothetical protein